MWLKLKNNLYANKTFWIIKDWIDSKIITWFWKIGYKTSYKINQLNQTIRIFYISLSSLLSVVFCSVLIVFILILIGKYEHYLPIDIPTGSIVNTDGFLIAIASISGIFLGLYFTAISSITSNYLLRAPIDVKNFFLAGPQGKQYMYIIKITAITSIFCIASSKLFGVKIGLFALMFLSLSVIYIVARFWSIGVDVFNSLEPQNALPWITKDILDSIQSVNPPGFQWNKPAIQNHHKNLTNNALNLINNLISFGSKEMKVSDEQLILALNYIGVVLYKYSDLKKKIPTTSLWYETKIQFRDWDTSPFFETHMALRTGTTLSPQTVKDHTWFEERILNIAVMVLDQFSEKRKPEVFLQGYSIFANIAEKYGNSLDTESLKMLFRKLDETEKFMSLINTDKDSKQQEINKVSFADLQGRLCSISIVGLLKYLKTSDNIDQKISNINWNHSSGIYKSGLPHTILSELESTLEKLTNEKTIEEKYVSNQWYIKMLCVQKYLFSLQQHFEYLKSLHNDFFRPRVNNLIQKKQWRSASQLILRWIECSNKYSLLVSSMEEHVADCSKLQRVKDFPWPEFDINSELQIASERKKEVSDIFILLLPHIEQLKKREDLPDYFGQAMALGFEACYESFQENDLKRLQIIFPVIFTEALASCSKLVERTQEWNDQERQIITIIEPLVNLAELSGYAKLYSEMHQNSELWTIVEKCWDVYFRNTNPKAMELVAMSINDKNFGLRARPQGERRLEWKYSFYRTLQEKGLTVEPSKNYPFDIEEREEISNHPSPLIRTIVHLHSSFYDIAREVFIATYLSNHTYAKGIEFSNEIHLKELIQNEKEGNIYKGDE